MKQGQIDAAVDARAAITVLQGGHPDLRILADTRTQKDTLAIFGGEYPGGALYSTAAWVGSHEKDTQALTNCDHEHAGLDTFAFAGRDHGQDAAGTGWQDKDLYLAALKSTIPMYSVNGRMDPKGADAVLAVFSEGSPDVAKANVDVSKTFTNKIGRAGQKDHGMNANRSSREA